MEDVKVAIIKPTGEAEEMAAKGSSPNAILPSPPSLADGAKQGVANITASVAQSDLLLKTLSVPVVMIGAPLVATGELGKNAYTAVERAVKGLPSVLNDVTRGGADIYNSTVGRVFPATGEVVETTGGGNGQLASEAKKTEPKLSLGTPSEVKNGEELVSSGPLTAELPTAQGLAKTLFGKTLDISGVSVEIRRNFQARTNCAVEGKLAEGKMNYTLVVREGVDLSTSELAAALADIRERQQHRRSDFRDEIIFKGFVEPRHEVETNAMAFLGPRVVEGNMNFGRLFPTAQTTFAALLLEDPQVAIHPERFQMFVSADGKKLAFVSQGSKPVDPELSLDRTKLFRAFIPEMRGQKTSQGNR